MAVGKVSFQGRLRSDFAGLETDSNEAALIWGWPWNQTTKLHLMFLQHVEASIALAMEPARSKEHLYLHETLKYTVNVFIPSMAVFQCNAHI